VWSIEGEIPLVYTQGLVVYSENTWNKLLKVWPCFLIYCALVDKYQLPFSKALLPVYKEQKDIVYLSPYLTNPMQKLTSFLEYYESTRHHPSPLMPDWLEAIIQGDQEKLQKQMDQIFQSGQFNYTDETAQWLFNSDNLPDAEGLIRTWQPIAHQLFDDLYQAWGKK